ncbi:rRNA maturation RNase YbeY [Candidatus Gottesmanbacteria bacterium]|nr:rRNA maturation RNase YbeY [Candidatus Gottesmanbacteria bacterium]
MISILFHTESHFPVDRNKIKEALMRDLAGRIKSHTEVNLTIIGDRQMHELNKKYRHIDATTDVLSFPLNDPTDRSEPFLDSPDGVLRLGDIVVSYPQAVSQAAEENKLVDDKIIELALHGLNHLLGIHHPE